MAKTAKTAKPVKMATLAKTAKMLQLATAKLTTFPYDSGGDEADILDAFAEGRMEDARIIAAVLLARRGDQLSRIAATLLMPEKRSGKRGPKTRTIPKHWLAIGKSFDAMRRDGLSSHDAIKNLIKEFGYKQRTVEGTLAFYRRTQSSLLDPDEYRKS